MSRELKIKLWVVAGFAVLGLIIALWTIPSSKWETRKLTAWFDSSSSSRGTSSHIVAATPGAVISEGTLIVATTDWNNCPIVAIPSRCWFTNWVEGNKQVKMLIRLDRDSSRIYPVTAGANDDYGGKDASEVQFALVPGQNPGATGHMGYQVVR